MSIDRRKFLKNAAAGMALAPLGQPALAQKTKLRFAVGPLLPNPDDTKKAFGRIFAHLAKELGVDYELAATTDWAGMAVAMGGGQLDVGWMGP
jgi:phosphonate transport system substrate-binding protein